jgi:hypothetical protein
LFPVFVFSAPDRTVSVLPRLLFCICVVFTLSSFMKHFERKKAVTESPTKTGPSSVVTGSGRRSSAIRTSGLGRRS